MRFAIKMDVSTGHRRAELKPIYPGQAEASLAMRSSGPDPAYAIRPSGRPCCAGCARPTSAPRWRGSVQNACTAVQRSSRISSQAGCRDLTPTLCEKQSSTPPHDCRLRSFKNLRKSMNRSTTQLQSKSGGLLLHKLVLARELS